MSPAQKKGRALENRVARILGRRGFIVHSGKWIEFVDANGFGYCQPDHFIVLPNRILCFEVKLTQVETGYTQISELYAPVLEHIYARPVVGVVVCGRLLWDPGALQVWNYEALFTLPPDGEIRTWLLT